ncbi:MAG: hypothetical protein GC190_21975 [Alphaproteobacteria bacterium]|nr:hypothetical protein [Alphaproteobacteria bacterium]
MASYVYEIATGKLVSYSPSDTVASDEVLASYGRAAARDLPALDDTHAWDEATHTVIVVPAPVRPRMVSTFAFIGAFTAAEFKAIRSSTDDQMQHLLYMLERTSEVDMNGATLQQGLAYAVALNLITQARADEIGAIS